MAELKHPVTGHVVKTDDESADFWTAAGYRAVETNKAPAKKAASAKKSSK